ncbi:hypothetical protein GCM10010174_54160 [Kutzneria viridogrisea]|uniref:Uncharacterized protein n=2 Tax=Kutzneria TaxID=43356 RepID=W5W2B7_9PSEU|nr:hypothetical protein [Kutzneria albida]AHH94636.1 hypothetical protein KALB_1263 [Kutzneria albida DSM 43870]MBA8930304.1 hypothetical protein [Kutzneria viridogrisea]
MPGARVSAVVVDRGAGWSPHEEQPAQLYRSASLVKLLIAVDVLARHGEVPGLHAMLSASDDDVANELWDADGGPEVVTRSIERLRLPTARPPLIPGRWGDTAISTADVVTTYEYVLDVLPAAHRELVLGALADAPRHAADGFDQYFGVPAVFPRPWAIKQGWSVTAQDRVLHTSGLVGEGWPRIVVVLAAFPPDTDWDTARAAVNAATEVVRDRVTWL